MSILSLSNISKRYDDELFSSVTFEVDTKDKIGFVGANGAGKTTIFKIILDQIKSDTGDVFIQKFLKIGYMQQHLNLDKDNSILHETMNVFSHLIKIENDLDEINHKLDSASHDELDSLVKKQHNLQQSYADQGGNTFRSRTKSMLLGLGFSKLELEGSISTLSGGEQTKVSLAKMLLSDADLLLLDEPTNHLDIESVEWLESFLANYQKAFIVISHDRRFLDNITNKTLDLSHGKLKVYSGNYSSYVKQKLLDEQQINRDNKNIQKEIDRINGIIEQQKRWNRQRNIKTAESKQKIVDKLKKELKQTTKQDKNMRLSFDTDTRGGNEVVRCENVSKSYDNKKLFSNIDFTIKHGERVFLLGANGCGKSTLFKIIQNSITPDTGKTEIGSNIVSAYFDQTQANLNFNKTAFDNVSDNYPKMTETEIRNKLGLFLFTGDDAFKTVSDLSGGEKAKLSLLLLMLSKSNFLLLDEPTNHLDIGSKQALQTALEDYTGTMFIISHDRYLINDLADRILYLSENKITEYLGNYDEYLSKKSTEQDKEQSTVAKPAGKNDYQKKKELTSKINKLNGKISRKEDEITELEAKISDIQNEMAKPEIATDHVKMMELNNENESLSEQELKLYDELHNLECEMQELTLN